MGVLDKFLNVMRLNPEDDDDFYNEDYDYDDDYTEDEPKQTFRREKKRETVGQVREHHLQQAEGKPQP